jgi:Flp pilus assembly protein TadG
MRAALRSFKCNEQGSMSLLFGVMMIPVIGAMGAAVDYGLALRVRAIQQTISDQTALVVADAETVAAATAGFNIAQTELSKRLGDKFVLDRTNISGKWLDGSRYRLTISTKVRTMFVHLLPRVGNEMVVAVATTVSRVAPVYETKPPTLSLLSPEAGDYNRIYFYCYSSDPERQKEPDQGRRGVTPIADNATVPTDYSSYTSPTCGKNEAPSYMLRNVRNARTSKDKWDDKKQEVYEYYTDTVIDTGLRVQTMRMRGYRDKNGDTRTFIEMGGDKILETIICSDDKSCQPRKKGGILPNNHETHDPVTATGSCDEGKFMYYGWEDRPPSGSSDRDYDDIRLLISCPKLVKISDKKIKIIE